MSRSLVAVLSLSVVLAVAGYDERGVPSPAAPASTAASPSAAGATGTQTIQVGNRPFTLHVPAGYQPGRPRRCWCCCTATPRPARSRRRT